MSMVNISKISIEGRYGLVDKMHPSCVGPEFKTRVQH